MCDKPIFFICKHCGNIVEKIHDSGVPVVCCGEPMSQLTANTTDAAQEKHVPVIEMDGNEVSIKIGSAVHPMVEEHYIQWIYLVTSQGLYRKCLKPGDVPKASFKLCDGEKVIAAYEYCNLHGLWVAEL